MGHIVGIDLGTTNSLIGIVESGFPILLANENGERLMPSVVHFPETGEPVVGQAALRTRVTAPQRTVSSIKRLIGTRVVDAKKENFANELSETRNGFVNVRIGEREFSPEEISALILQELKRNTERALGREVSRAVITVPAYFNDAQRSATKRAGELAGFAVERIINEPTAAALAFGLDRGKLKSKIAVYDLGGGTFDISILQLNEGIFEVLATNGDTHLGGDDIDQAIIGDFKSQILDWDAKQRARLRDALIEAKHRLSVEDETAIDIPFVNPSTSFHTRLTRHRLEELARPIIDRTRWHCARALADAKLKVEKLDEVILVGGATRMPLVRETAHQIFKREPNVSQNPDETVAIGATIQAGILEGAMRDVLLLDVTPLSLGIETFGGLMNVIIPRNSTIPIKAGEMFTTAVNNQRAMSIKVLQGEREMARENWFLGEFEIAFAPAPKGIPRVGVQFEIDVNGILRVLARDTKTGAERVLEMKSAIDVSDEAVEKMLADSLEHAFEDVSERTWVETKLKAEEMLNAVDLVLQKTSEALGESERGRIAAAQGEVRAAIENGELTRLQRANVALDTATQHLAATVLEKAIAQPKSPS
jgi:molecular chaperone DnaK